VTHSEGGAGRALVDDQHTWRDELGTCNFVLESGECSWWRLQTRCCGGGRWTRSLPLSLATSSSFIWPLYRVLGSLTSAPAPSPPRVKLNLACMSGSLMDRRDAREEETPTPMLDLASFGCHKYTQFREN
jgi:hypothetical protein